MATCNGAAYLRRQLDSLAAQTWLPHELVVCDDRSSDDTVAIVEAFATTAPFRVEVSVNPERFGYRRNFIRTGGRCAGEIVFFCDQDDIWASDKIATMMAVFRDPRVLLAYHNATVIDADGDPISRLYDDAAQKRAIDPADPEPFHHSMGFGQAYRRDLHRFDDIWPLSVDHCSIGPERLAHDQWYVFLATMLGRVAYVERRLVDYRQHGANVYGVERVKARSRLRRVVGRALLGPRWDDARFAAAAAGRRDAAAAVVPRVDGGQRRLALAAAGRYADLATWLGHRHALIHDPRLADRLDALVANIRAGAYLGGGKWRLQPSWIIGDAVRALGGRLAARHRASAVVDPDVG